MSQFKWRDTRPSLPLQEAFWKEQLRDGIPVMQVPSDHQRAVTDSFIRASETVEFDETLRLEFMRLAARENAAPFVKLLAAVEVLLLRYTGQEDIIVGSISADSVREKEGGRRESFANPVVLRTNLQGNPSVAKLEERIANTIEKVAENRDYPFDQILKHIDMEETRARAPVFQVMFVLCNVQHCLSEEPISEEDLAEIGEHVALCDVVFVAYWGDNGLAIRCEYDAELFEATSIKQMLGHLETLLQGMVAEPGQRIGQLPLLTEDQQHALVVEWNDTRQDYPEEVCVHELFEAQVEEIPDAIALVLADQQMTYRELNARANRLAIILMDNGVAAQDRVALVSGRSLKMIVGLLAILKAGASYVPIDPEYPPERQRYIAENSNVSLVLADEASALEAFRGGPLQSIVIDADVESPLAEDNLPLRTDPDSLAYVIYTSGSTGLPKGVETKHSSVVNLIHWVNSTFDVGRRDRLLFVSSMCFDLSVYDVFGILGCGGTVVTATNEDVRDPYRLMKLITDENVTYWDSVPTTLDHLVRTVDEAGDSVRPEGLRLVFLSGDRIPVSLPDRIRKRFPNSEVISLGGATEGTVWSIYYPIGQVDPSQSSIPYGRPVGNNRFYVLDPYWSPQPVGVPGELHIGGLGVAAGYANNHEMTIDHFLPDPFWGVAGSRMYRTGDLGRIMPDGNIEFLGRKDYGVKIRGFRIELGEIEAVLAQHRAVREVAVIVREDSPGDKRLVAYIVLQGRHVPRVSELRRFLKRKLPDYMLPAAFMILKSMPLTPNQKIDRRALPAPGQSRPELDGALVSPRTETEKILAEIWAAVLNVDKVGIYDNFFELGGDSMLGIQIIARANQAGLTLTSQALFQHQTVAELARVAGARPVVQTEQGLVTGLVPLTPIQHWFFQRELPEPHHFNQSFVFEVSACVRPDLLEQALRQLPLHHDALRMRFESAPSGWRQVNAAPGDEELLTVADLSHLSLDDQGVALESAVADQQASLNLTEGPLIRCSLFRLGNETPHKLLMIIHHLVVDSVSWRILVEDLTNAYQQISRGEPVRLPPKTTSYRDWACRLTEYARSEGLTSSVGYWLGNTRTDLNSLPRDHASGREANSVASAASVSVSLSVEQTRALLQEVPHAYNTQITDVLLTALVQAVGNWTGERSLMVDLEGHGRQEISDGIDLSRTVGWFTSICPAWLDLGHASRPGDALKSIKEQLRRIPDQGIDYGVMRYLGSDTAARARLAAMPKAEVMFNYLGQWDKGLSLPPLLGIANEHGPADQSPKGSRSHLLEVTGLITGGRLRLSWTYSTNVHKSSTIQSLAQDFIESLKCLIDHCQSVETRGYTPSDFPDSDLTQRELDDLFADLGGSDTTKDEGNLQ